jgi:rfaE bifunctional protein nucleotidyltransferase chain/domain
VRTLEAARALGDCLVVCLNSDASVRRLKGTGRPVVPQDERAAVLLALGCVDAVVAFDEDTPELLLARLRPDVWAKGGDHLAHELPERHVVEGCGGRCVALPYVAGRSTTTLIREAGARAG